MKRRRNWLRMGCMRASVLYGQASQYRDTPENELLDGNRPARHRMGGLVVEGAQKADAIYGDAPVFGHANFAATKSGDHLNHSLLALNVSLPKINFKTAENGKDLTPLKILCADSGDSAAKNINRVDSGIRRIRIHSLIPIAPPPIHPGGLAAPASKSLHHQHDADTDDKDRPDGLDADAADSQLVQLEQDSHQNQHPAPDVPAAVTAAEHIEQAKNDENHRPEPEHVLRGNNSQLVEEERHADQQNDYPENQAPAEVPQVVVNFHCDLLPGIREASLAGHPIFPAVEQRIPRPQGPTARIGATPAPREHSFAKRGYSATRRGVFGDWRLITGERHLLARGTPISKMVPWEYGGKRN